MITSNRKLEKLIQRLHGLVDTLIEHRNDLIIHRNIDQFYYMQKEEQLKELLEQLNKALEQLEVAEDKIESEYKQIYCQWRGDVRWMNKHLYISNENSE